MPYRTFLIPVADDGSTAEDLNAFLRRVKVVAVEKQLLPERGAWAFCIEFLDGPGSAKSGGRATAKVDYRAILPPEVFAVYASLRDLRKRLAEQAGVPVYAVFTNEQLAGIARTRPASANSLQAIEGVGEARVQAYGQAVLDHLQSHPAASAEACGAS